MNQILRSLAAHILPPALTLIGALLFWQFWVQWRDIAIIVVPPPSEVLERFVDDPAFFWREGAWTLYEATLGLLLGSSFALALAIAMAHSRLTERALFPLAIIIKVTPIVAVAPVLVIIFGFGTTPKVLVAALFSFFPMLVNAMTGFRDVNPGALDFMRSLRAPPPGSCSGSCACPAPCLTCSPPSKSHIPSPSSAPSSPNGSPATAAWGWLYSWPTPTWTRPPCSPPSASSPSPASPSTSSST